MVFLWFNIVLLPIWMEFIWIQHIEKESDNILKESYHLKHGDNVDNLYGIRCYYQLQRHVNWVMHVVIHIIHSEKCRKRTTLINKIHYVLEE